MIVSIKDAVTSSFHLFKNNVEVYGDKFIATCISVFDSFKDYSNIWCPLFFKESAAAALFSGNFSIVFPLNMPKRRFFSAITQGFKRKFGPLLKGTLQHFR